MNKIKFPIIFLIFTILLFSLIYGYHKQTSQDVIRNAHVKIRELLLNYQAYRNYVSKIQKKEIYNLQKSKIIDKDYFHPALLSSTYSARQVNILYNQLREKQGLKPIQLKFASDNPRNPKNLATKQESFLLRQFNNKTIKEYSRVLDTNNGKILYYAIPTKPTVKKCMKCHSSPEFAPKGLIKRYGSQAGFYEKIGNIRAILSITYSLDDDLNSAKKEFWKLTALSIFIFMILLFIVYMLINNKNKLELAVKTALEENTKQLQTLQQQNKMAAMGEMMGAIAHQWRQPLNTISTSIQNLEYDYIDGYLNDKKFIEKFIEKNKKTIKFMSKTIDDFRNFFRVDKEKSNFKVKESTQAVIDMQSTLLKSNNITLNISGHEFIYYSFQSEYQQVILNIINNAKDAIVENNIENPIIDIVFKNNCVTIKDNAGGIPIDIIDRIFEPYFTTKEQGKGTGMGLYMSKMIIEDNMGGSLKVKNIDNGACFYINFNHKNEKI